jgi:hypothetical protein
MHRVRLEGSHGLGNLTALKTLADEYDSDDVAGRAPRCLNADRLYILRKIGRALSDWIAP